MSTIRTFVDDSTAQTVGGKTLGTSANPTVDIISKGPWVDVRAYGAKGDGVTDDSAAIQNAINSLPSTGGKVYIPSKLNFLVTATIDITNWGTYIVGDSRIGSKITFNPSSANQTCFRFGYNGVTNPKIQDFGISGIQIQNTSGGSSKKTAIGIYDGVEGNFKDITLTTIYGGGVSIGIYDAGRDTHNFENIQSQADYPFYFDANPVFANTGLNSGIFKNIHVYPNGNYGYFVNAGIYISNFEFTGFNLTSGGQYGFYFHNGNTSTVSDHLNFNNFGMEVPATTGGYVIFIDTPAASSVVQTLTTNMVSWGGGSTTGLIYLRGVRTSTMLNNVSGGTMGVNVGADDGVVTLINNNANLNIGGNLKRIFYGSGPTIVGGTGTTAIYSDSANGALTNLTDIQIQSTLATGTAPLSVSSTTKVANLVVEGVGTQSSSGTPAGTPVGGGLIFDTSNNKLWAYNGTAWKSTTLT